jgi:ABC-2 type transport system permease protein
MTTVRPVAATPAPARTAPARVRGGAVRLAWRLVRRGALLVWLTVAAYLVVEAVSFRSAYPDAASRAKLLDLSRSTAVRMLQGVPGAIDTAGGFAVWDGGWMITLIVGCWAALTTVRLTRAEEDTGRTELVLACPIGARSALAAVLAAMALALSGLAVVAALTFVVLGEPVRGAVVWGAGLGVFGAVICGLAAVAAQLLEPRRSASALALGLTAVAFLVRVVANSADDRAWLLAAAPFGWVDELHAFSGQRPLWLLAPLAAAALLAVVAVALRGRRDTGAAVLRSAAAGRSRLGLLRGPYAFGWRQGSGTLTAWAVALAVTSTVFGMMTGAVVDFVRHDPTYRRMLEEMGMDMSVPVVGFLSYLSVFLALPVALFAGWRLGALRQDEAAGRLDNLLVRGVRRGPWLAVSAAQALAAAVVLVAVSACALWAGARLAGVRVTTWQVLEPVAGTLPLIALFVGVATLAFGLAPRLTVAVPVTLAVLAYLLDIFGALLGWPSAVLEISPFHHLARLPATPMSLSAVVSMLALGVAAACGGIAAFRRRDLCGA